MAPAKQMNATYVIQKMGAGYMDYITLDIKTAKKLTTGGNKRVLCTLNGTLSIHAAVMKTKEGMYYIMISAAVQKRLGVKTGSKITADIQIDKSDLQFSVPEEFAEVIATDPAAKKVFDNLTDGNKRGLIALVNRVKSVDKRIGKSLLIAKAIKAGIIAPAKVMALKSSG
jgi:hypothetical protein